MSDLGPDLGGEDSTDPAAEYVLGLQGPADRARAAERLRIDPGFRAQVAAWEERLAPLLDEVVEAPAPPRVWDQISRTIEAGSNVTPFPGRTRLWDQVGVWRGATAALLAVAACLAVLVVLPTRRPASINAGRAGFIAAAAATLASPSGKVLYVATLDRAGQRLTLVPIEGPSSDARTPELWIIPAGGAPKPVGLLPNGRPVQLALANGSYPAASPPTLAVSLEPAGGSPTGKPSGPVIAAGLLKAA